MKQKKNRKTMIFFIMMISMLLLPTTLAVDPPTVSIEPKEPKPNETVTFTVSIPSDQTVTEAVIFVEECEEGLCFIDNFNETLTETGSNTYEASITLKHETADVMKYRVGYSTPSGWVWYPEDTNERISVNLDTNANGGNNGGNGNTDTPGFELISLFAAVSFISFILYKRKR